MTHASDETDQCWFAPTLCRQDICIAARPAMVRTYACCNTHKHLCMLVHARDVCMLQNKQKLTGERHMSGSQMSSQNLERCQHRFLLRFHHPSNIHKMCQVPQTAAQQESTDAKQAQCWGAFADMFESIEVYQEPDMQLDKQAARTSSYEHRYTYMDFSAARGPLSAGKTVDARSHKCPDSL